MTRCIGTFQYLYLAFAADGLTWKRPLIASKVTDPLDTARRKGVFSVSFVSRATDGLALRAPDEVEFYSFAHHSYVDRSITVFILDICR